MELYASEDINDIQNQNKANRQVTNLNKTNCGPFRPHKINETIKYSGIEHAEKSNIGKNSKSNEVHTWIALVAMAPSGYLSSSF